MRTMDALIERARVLKEQGDKNMVIMRDLAFEMQFLMEGISGLARDLQAMRGTPLHGEGRASGVSNHERHYTPHGSHGLND